MIRLTPQKLRDIISESVIKILLTESQESASIKAAVKLIMDRWGYSKEQADSFIRIDLRASLPILRSKEGGKFILGVTRMYLDRQISDASTISSLNQTLKYIVTPAHYNEYDRNLNGLSAQQLIDRFKQARTDDLENDKAELGKTQYTEHPEYKIVRIDSFEQAKQYGRYNDWCLAQPNGKYNFDQYTSNGVNQLYFILRDGFENEPRVKGENAPYDSYGLSMMTVIVDPEGMMTQSTTRWNHENDSSDSAFTPKQISEIIGRNFYEVFKPNTKFKDAVADALKRLRNGEPIVEIFDDAWEIDNGLYGVELLNKYNIVTPQKAFKYQKWFDDIWSFNGGLARVRLNGKWSFINTKGELMGDGNIWFDDAWSFKEGLAMVELNGKYSFINTNGELIGDGNLWFDFVGGFKEGFAIVRLNEKFYFIKILSNNEVQFYNYNTKKPIPSPLNNQNESKRKMIGLRITESQYRKLLKEMTAEEITAEAAETNTEPTEKQKEAGNYKKGHVYVKGMKISIEQPKGSIRKGTDGKGKEWKTKMSNHYGYFSRTVGKDGDHVDVFLGPDIDEFDKVFVVDQKVNGKFDESKVMLGFKDIESAKQAYLSNYSKDWKGFWKITGVPLEIFKVWLYRGRKQRQPFYQYVLIRKNRLAKKKK